MNQRIRKEIPFSQKELFEFFKIDLEKGELIWKPRHRKYFNNDHDFKRWNKIYPYNRAGNRKSGTSPTVSLFGVYYMISRIMWKMITGSIDVNCDVMHIDRDTHNLKWTNLKLVTQSENRHRATYNSKTGCVGVYWHKTIQKWVASITVNNKIISLGLYDKFKDAVKARKDGEKKYWNKGGENV